MGQHLRPISISQVDGWLLLPLEPGILRVVEACDFPSGRQDGT